MQEITYRPPASLSGFLTSDKFLSLVTGPVGSGKSSAAMVKILYHAAKMRPQRDGIRRSRAVVVRNTRQMLTDATVPTFSTWFRDGEAGVFMRTDNRFCLRFDDIECDVLFRGLDDANDVRRLLSLEVSFGVMDEFREIHPDIFDALQARVGRYPSVTDGGCLTDEGTVNKHVWGASNAPDEGSFWETFLTAPPKTAQVFRQPSARSPEMDWRNILSDPAYYDDLVEGKSEDWLRVYIDNEFGRLPAGGRPVWSSFSRDAHVAKERPAVMPVEFIVGVDAGLNPTAVVTQQTHDGRVVVHEAVTGNAEGMGALRFIREKLKPMLARPPYDRQKVLIVIDPSAFQRAQTDERCVADIFRTEGFAIRPARSNSVAARLAVVEKYLTRQVNGLSGLLVSPAAGLLIEAMAGKYRYKINTKGVMDDTPEKSHPWSDVADAFQYACLHHDGGSLFRGDKPTERREIKRVSYAWV